jgi:hypothetical protein
VTILTSSRVEVGATELREIAISLRTFQHEKALAMIESMANDAPPVVRFSGEDLAGPDLAEFRDAALDALVCMRTEDYTGAIWQVLMLGDLVGVNLDVAAGVTRF